MLGGGHYPGGAAQQLFSRHPVVKALLPHAPDPRLKSPQRLDKVRYSPPSTKSGNDHAEEVVEAVNVNDVELSQTP
jgi:hypothetical protein